MLGIKFRTATNILTRLTGFNNIYSYKNKGIAFIILYLPLLTLLFFYFLNGSQIGIDT